MIVTLLNQMPLPLEARWIPFEPDLLGELEDGLDAVDAARVCDNAKRGIAAVLAINETPLCAVGLVDLHGGAGEVWAVIDRKRKHLHPLLLTRCVRRAVGIAAQYMGLATVQMFVQSKRTDAQEWAVALGFSPCGELTIYGHPERDHFIFSRSL